MPSCAPEAGGIATTRGVSLTGINAALRQLTRINVENAPIVDFPRDGASTMTYIKPAAAPFRRRQRLSA
jgi:hypothetical protein